MQIAYVLHGKVKSHANYTCQGEIANNEHHKQRPCTITEYLHSLSFKPQTNHKIHSSENAKQA